jgi:hypothetical protein
MVIKLYYTSIAGRRIIGILNQACARSKIRMLKGNRDKRKINMNEGLIITTGEKIVWHLYVLPMMGPALGFDWLRKLLVEVDNRLVAIDYVIRESAQLGGKDKNLVIHYEPRGCKGYNPEIGSNLMGQGFKIRICSCTFEKEEYNDRKARRIESNQQPSQRPRGSRRPPFQAMANDSTRASASSTRKARSARPATSWTAAGTQPRTASRSARSSASSSPTPPSRAIAPTAKNASTNTTSARSFPPHSRSHTPLQTWQ